MKISFELTEKDIDSFGQLIVALIRTITGLTKTTARGKKSAGFASTRRRRGPKETVAKSVGFNQS